MSYLPVTNSSPIEKSLTFLDEVKLEEKICKKNIISEEKTLIASPFNNYILEQRQDSFFNWLLDDISATIDCQKFLNKKNCLKQDSVLEKEDLHKIYKNFKHIICFRNFSLEKFIYKLKYELKYQTASYSYSLENNINYFADSYLKNPFTHVQEPLETILNNLLFANLNSSNIHSIEGLYLKKIMTIEDNFMIEEKIKQILNINNNTIQKININLLVQKIINHPCILTNHKKGMIDLLNIESEKKKNNTNNNFLPISISRCKPFLHMPIECRLLERVIIAQFMDKINISNINNNNIKIDKEVCYKVCISLNMDNHNNGMLKFPVWLITTLYNFINKLVVEESVLKFMKFFFYQFLSGGNLIYMLPNAEVYKRTSHLNKKKKKKKNKEKGKDECLDLLDSDCHRILKKLCFFYIIMLVIIKESKSINDSKEMDERDEDVTEESYSDMYNTTVFSHFEDDSNININENGKKDNSKEKINKNNPLDIYLKNIFTDINGNFHIILNKDMPSFKDSLLRNLQYLVVNNNNFDKTNGKENIITIERLK